MEIKTFDEIYSDIMNFIISHQDKLTDFNDGSVLASQCEALGRELAELYIRTRVGFSTYLRSLPSSVFGFNMKTGMFRDPKIEGCWECPKLDCPNHPNLGFVNRDIYSSFCYS